VHALTARGLLEKGRRTMPDVRRALAALSPEDQAAVLAYNERYTFFRLADGGAVGSLGVELTPGRSIATDPRLVPLGSLAYLATPSARRFVVSQDTGAAIVGARADLFLGPGADAEARAGRMHERGALYLFTPR
jgi:membrane-bound lytic murein transglycosylase A